MADDPYASIAAPVAQGQPQGDPYASIAAPAQSEWKPTPYGFKVRDAVTPDTGKPTVQREDGALYYGPEQGNTGKPAWFGANGQPAEDTTQHKPTLLEHVMFSSPIQGITNVPASALQMVAQIPGVPKSAREWVQNLINDRQRAFKALPENQTWMADLNSGIAGTAALGALVPGLSGGPIVAQGAAQAMMQPVEGNVEDVAQNKLIQGGAGAATAGALKVAGKGVGALINKARSIGSTPAPAELLDELGSKLGGKSPGQALQDAANDKYNAAWDLFHKAMDPVDAEAGGAKMDYGTAIDKLKDVLGVGQKRVPMAMPEERRRMLTGLLNDLQEAGDQAGNVDNSFAGAIGIVKRLGSEARRLAVAHGDTEARAMLGDVRDSVLQSMNESNPGLSDSAKEARQIFATKVAPLFDKSEGGNYLTQIRDSSTPGDLLASGNQGSLARMRPDKAGIIARGSAAEPMLYSYLDAAINQAKGNPRAFADSIQKAMPAIQEIAPEMAETFKGMSNVARTARWSGLIANIGAAATVGKYIGPMGMEMGGATGMLAPAAISGPGLMWKLLQSPATRNLLSLASKLPSGSPELELLAGDIAKAIPRLGGSVAGNAAISKQDKPEQPTPEQP